MQRFHKDSKIEGVSKFEVGRQQAIGDMGHMLGDPMKWTQTLSAILKNAV